MNVTIRTQDLLNQLVEELNSKFNNYTAKKIRQHVAERSVDEYQATLIEQGVWHGHYENFGPLWKIDMELNVDSAKGPRVQEVSLCPVLDFVFADIYPKVFSIEIGFDGFPDREDRPKLAGHPHLDGNVWDLTYFYNADLTDI